MPILFIPSRPLRWLFGCSLPPRLDAQHSAVERERAVLAAERATLRQEHARVQQQRQDLAARLATAASSSDAGEEQAAERARVVAQREEALERRARELEGQEAALVEQRAGLAQQEAELLRQHAAVRELVGDKQRELEAVAQQGEELARQQAGMQVRTLYGRSRAAVRRLCFFVHAAPVKGGLTLPSVPSRHFVCHRRCVTRPRLGWIAGARSWSPSEMRWRRRAGRCEGRSRRWQQGGAGAAGLTFVLALAS